MNFVEALKLVKEGKLVRRNSWELLQISDVHMTGNISMKDGKLVWRSNVLAEGKRAHELNFLPSMEDILANDWIEIKS